MSYTIDLSGKVAIVTGSSRGLGRAISIALGRAGANVVVTSRRPSTLKPVEEEIAKYGVECMSCELDVRKIDGIEKVVDNVITRFGHIDILVNNAGMNIRKSAIEVELEDWENVLNTNLRSTFFFSQKVAPYMMKQRWGRIINIGSATSIFGFPNINPYCASRGGILQLTKSLAAEWGRYGITVNVVGPGWFKTEQTKVLWANKKWVSMMEKRIPAGRLAEPEEIGPAVVFLASEDASYINGTFFMVDGGFTTGGDSEIMDINSLK